MKITIIDNKTIHLRKIKELLHGHELTVLPYLSDTLFNDKTVELYLLTGGSVHSVIGNENYYRKEIELIKFTEKPILGICLGFELIACAYGAKLMKLNSKVKGIINIAWTKKMPQLFNTYAEKISRVYESHRWIVTGLSDNLEGFARSEYGFEVISHKSKPIIGFQFHPELFINQTEGEKVFQAVVDYLTSV